MFSEQRVMKWNISLTKGCAKDIISPMGCNSFVRPQSTSDNSGPSLLWAIYYVMAVVGYLGGCVGGCLMARFAVNGPPLVLVCWCYRWFALLSFTACALWCLGVLFRRVSRACRVGLSQCACRVGGWSCLSPASCDPFVSSWWRWRGGFGLTRSRCRLLCRWGLWWRGRWRCIRGRTFPNSVGAWSQGGCTYRFFPWASCGEQRVL